MDSRQLLTRLLYIRSFATFLVTSLGRLLGVCDARKMAEEESEADYGDEEDERLRLRCKNRKPTPPVDPYPGTLCVISKPE